MAMRFRIGNRPLRPGRTYIIAEIGSNHDGSIAQARKLITAAARCGVDAVKFQTFVASRLYNQWQRDPKGDLVPNPIHEKLKTLELPVDWHAKLKKHCDRLGVHFLSTPFDEKSADLLHSVGCPAFKIASGDMTHHGLLGHVAKKGKPIILSTGMSTLQEVKEAVKVIRRAANRKIVLLHCVSNYPPAPDQANIRSMTTLGQALGLPVGYSDHSPGIAVPLGAVALGAVVIEKHITFSNKLPGPDHPYALEVDEFSRMVTEIRTLDEALGSATKKPTRAEVPERKWARRGLYAVRDLEKGERLTGDAVAVLRPCEGIGAEDFQRAMGKTLRRSVASYAPIRWEDL